jgi:hypothetical protein
MTRNLKHIFISVILILESTVDSVQRVEIGSVCCALSERISEQDDCHGWAK